MCLSSNENASAGGVAMDGADAGGFSVLWNTARPGRIRLGREEKESGTDED